MNCTGSCFNSCAGRTGDILLESQNANGSFWLEENLVSISPIRCGHQVPRLAEGLLANLWLLRWEPRSRLSKRSPAPQSCWGVSQKEPPPRLQLLVGCSPAAKGLSLRIRTGVFSTSPSRGALQCRFSMTWMLIPWDVNPDHQIHFAETTKRPSEIN